MKAKNSHAFQPEIELTKVVASDLDVLKSYVEALYKFEEDYDSLVNIEDGLKSLFSNQQLATAYFIMRGTEKIGYVILSRYHSVEKGGLTVYIDELYVEDRFRRHGVGKMVLGQITKTAKKEGAKVLWANTEPQNEASQKFFKGAGFRKNSYLNFEREI